ncbi:DUF6571 family protein [Streptomyces sp. NBC_01197]|uniref:DUF6571 family protein n=1 Tax=Streptomyces sp. NBC_01197 TaxID=2903768 RepID=UPI002E1083BD|nr:hypothetical protein OG452_22015 [Streptomyces sp. NBC_01197]
MNTDNEPYPHFNGMVQISESQVSRAAIAAAAREAKRGAELAKKDPKDLSPAEFDELNAILALNNDQYPFAEKFAAALGPKGTLQFWEKMSGLSDAPAYRPDFERKRDLDELQKNLSLTIAQATNSDTPTMKAWKKEMVEIGDKPIREPGPPPHGDSGGPHGFLVMSNLMRYGDYDDKFLTDYGKALITEDKRVLEKSKQLRGSGWGGGGIGEGTLNQLGNDQGYDPMTGYMKALSNSPAAATKFFTAKHKGSDGKPESDFTYLFENRKWPNDSQPGKESVTGRNSMAWAIEAATTGHRPGEQATADDVKHSKAQAGLFSDLVKSVSADSDRLRKYPFMSDSFADAAAEYMPDLHRSLSSDIENGDQLFPTPGDTAKIDKYDAARFLHTVARNKEGYDTLNVSQHVYAAALTEQHVKHPDAYPESTQNTVNSISYETGLFQGVIGEARLSQANKNDADASTRGDAWKGQASTWGGSVVGSVTTLATAPFTGPVGVVAGGLAGVASGKVFDGLINGFGDDGGTEAKQQVYKNVKELDDVEHSTIVTAQEAAKDATGSENSESQAGDQAGQGFRDAHSLIHQTEADGSTN